MGVLQRIGDIMKSNINDILDKCEDPVKMTKQMLREATEDLAEVKQNLATIGGEKKGAERIIEDLKSKIAYNESVASNALKQGDEAAALAVLEKNQPLKVQLDSASKNLEKLNASYAQMEQAYAKLTENIQILKDRQTSVKTTQSLAKTQETINKMSSNINMDKTMGKFAEMEERAQKRLDKAMAEAEINEGSVGMSDADKAIAKYGGSSASANSDLEALKAKMGL